MQEKCLLSAINRSTKVPSSYRTAWPGCMEVRLPVPEISIYLVSLFTNPSVPPSLLPAIMLPHRYHSLPQATIRKEAAQLGTACSTG